MARVSKKKYYEEWLKENLPDNLDDIIHCVDAVFLLSDEQIKDHKKYIEKSLLNLNYS